MATATTQLTRSPVPAQIRPLNPRRDLSQVADLIELCFAETLDPDGKRYLKRMRQAGGKTSRRWFDPQIFAFNMSAEGFVWQENRAVIGNISLIPFNSLGRSIYLIANVAVHPDFRRRGIARALTMAALEWTEKRRIRSVWLQVRENNAAAVEMYQTIGFVQRARRITWTIQPGSIKGTVPPGARIVKNIPRYWHSQKTWLRGNYPNELFWYWPIRINDFRPGFWGMLSRFINETQIRQWGVSRDGQLCGFMSWKKTSSYADQLWVAAPPETEEMVLRTLLPYIRWRERANRPLSIDFPEGRAENALQEAGFQPDPALLWMQIKNQNVEWPHRK